MKLDNLEAFCRFSPARSTNVEKQILQQKDVYLATVYAQRIIEGRWLEAEPMILRKGTPIQILGYCNNVIEGRWLEAEELIFNQPIKSENLDFYNLQAIEKYLKYNPEAHKRWSKKTSPVLINNVFITDLPNSISNEQLSQVFDLMFQQDDTFNVRTREYCIDNIIQFRNMSELAIWMRKRKAGRITIKELQTMTGIGIMHRFNLSISFLSDHDDDFR
jgi:hypothetical protein